MAATMLWAAAAAAAIDAATPALPTAEAAEGYRDPFAYCRAVGTIDGPDKRYDGPAVPDSIADGLRSAFGAPPDAPRDAFVRGTTWRCMDGAVYACNVGANLPCSEKADLSRTPSAAIDEFCRQNADAEVVPAAVTGRATVFEWRCHGGSPQIVRQVQKADARGFVAGIWYRIAPPAK